MQCSDKERDELLYYLIAHHTGRTLVFTNAISGVRPGCCLAESKANKLLTPLLAWRRPAGLAWHLFGPVLTSCWLHVCCAVPEHRSHSVAVP